MHWEGLVREDRLVAKIAGYASYAWLTLERWWFGERL